MLVHRYRQQQRFYETLLGGAPAGDPANQEYRKKLMDGYRQAMFPHIHRTQESELARTKAVLDSAFMSGPIRVVGGRIENVR